MALPQDELYLISKKLTFDPDYIRFRSVCKSWRSAAPKRPQLPWLISYYPIDSDKNSILFNFYQFSFETNKLTRIPEFLDSPLLSSFMDNSTFCIGSSRGWIASINCRTSSVLLFNPLTNSSIDLPNLSMNVIFNSDYGFYLTSDPIESLSDCFAVIYDHWTRLWYCKVGSNDWNELALDLVYFNGHFCSYHGKHFFSLEGDVYVCDFGPDSSICKIISVNLDDVDTFTSKYDFERSWLVESDEDLLFVLFYYKADFVSSYYRVFRLEVECHPPKSVELKNLGNKALVLSPKTAFSLISSKYPGCKDSFIYSVFFVSDMGRPVDQMLNVHKFGRFVEDVLIKIDVAPLDVPDYNCDWFSPNLLI